MSLISSLSPFALGGTGGLLLYGASQLWQSAGHHIDHRRWRLAVGDYFGCVVSACAGLYFIFFALTLE